eukprot:scaffold495_cov157-Alexandrium_tamarense.AAC.1
MNSDCARQRTRSFDCSLRATNVSPKEDPIKGERKFLDLERRRLDVCEGREEKRYRVGLFGRVRTAPTALDTTCVRSRSTTSWILLYSELVHSTVDDTSHVRRSELCWRLSSSVGGCEEVVSGRARKTVFLQLLYFIRQSDGRGSQRPQNLL